MKPITQWTVTDITDFLRTVDKDTWVKIGIGAGIFLVLTYLIIWPAWFKRPAVLQEIKNLETQIMTTNNLYRRMPELLQNKEEYKKYIDEAKQVLYGPGEATLLLGAISKKAEDSGVAVIASQPTAFSEKFAAPFSDLYEGNAYSFTLEGGYHSLGAFVSRVESNPKLLKIQTYYQRPQDVNNPQKQIADVGLSAVSTKKAKTDEEAPAQA